MCMHKTPTSKSVLKTVAIYFRDNRLEYSGTLREIDLFSLMFVYISGFTQHLYKKDEDEVIVIHVTDHSKSGSYGCKSDE